MARSIWNGCLAVGELRIPVKLYGAVESKTVRFHEVHANDGARIEHRRIDPETGETVPYEHIVKGLELPDGSWVVLSDEEIKAAEGPHAKVVEIGDFVPAGQIDPVFYEHPYYLGPRNRSEDGYRLLHDALAKADRVGIGRIVLRTRERLVGLRALEDGVLGLSTMRFADEVVDPTAFDVPQPAKAPAKREREMAAQLVDTLAQPFDPTAFEDTYRAAVLALIERKAQGEPIEAPEQPAPAVPDDLEAALEAMLADARKGGDGRSGRGRAKRSRAGDGGAKRTPARSRSRAKAGSR